MPVTKLALITGASGMIGRRLGERLRDDGWRVVGLSAHPPKSGPWHDYIVADLAAPAAIDSVVSHLRSQPVPVIWHLAGKAHALAELGQDPDEYRRINLGGTKHMVAVAQRLRARRLVLASSTKAMGEGEAAVQDESTPCRPLSPYGHSKWEAEQAVLEPGAVPEPVVLRFCMVYGGRDRGNMGRMLSAVRRNRFPPFPETGNRRSFVYLDDAVTACVLAGTRAEAAGQIFLVTDGQLYSTRELYLAVRRALGRPPPLWSPPYGLFRFAAGVGDGLGRLLRRRMPLDSDSLAKLAGSAAYSSAKITCELGYAPAWLLTKGLAAMVEEMDRQEGKR